MNGHYWSAAVADSPSLTTDATHAMCATLDDPDVSETVSNARTDLVCTVAGVIDLQHAAVQCAVALTGCISRRHLVSP